MLYVIQEAFADAFYTLENPEMTFAEACSPRPKDHSAEINAALRSLPFLRTSEDERVSPFPPLTAKDFKALTK